MDTLIQPILTEKTSRLMEETQYVFQVREQASKVEVRKAIEREYPNVRVDGVRTQNVRGKTKTQFTRAGQIEGNTGSYKKAIVSLDPDGEQIDFFEDVY